MGHSVSEISVVLHCCFLEQLQHRGTVLGSVEHQDQDTDVCSLSRGYYKKSQGHLLKLDINFKQILWQRENKLYVFV